MCAAAASPSRRGDSGWVPDAHVNYMAGKTLYGIMIIVVMSSPAMRVEASTEPGVFTQCVAYNNGVTYAVLGAGTEAQCFQLARQCTGNPNVNVQWYDSPVLVQTPYTQCTAR
jgi:hypothetical protein